MTHNASAPGAGAFLFCQAVFLLVKFLYICPAAMMGCRMPLSGAGQLRIRIIMSITIDLSTSGPVVGQRLCQCLYKTM